MTLKHVALAMMCALGLQGLVFAHRYEDLLFLRRSVDAIAEVPPDVFAAYAGKSLARTALTRRHLETIALVAQRHDNLQIEIHALERLATEFSAEADVHLRLADALRRAGRFPEAERVYLDILGSAE